MHYRLFSAFSALTAVSLGCFATLLAPRWDNLRVKHAWKAVPENWESLGIPPASTTINLHVALKPHRKKALIAALYEVSSPGNPKHVLSTTPRIYGSHLSKEQVAKLAMPHPDTLELVESWLKFRGVLPSSISVSHGGNWLTLTGVSVSKANDLLGASYQLYRHTETNETIVRTIGYSLPAALRGHVQTVAPTTYFPSPRMSWQTPRKRSGWAATELVKATSGDLVTALLSRADDDDISFMRWLYNTETYVPAATDQNKLGIPGFSREYPNPVDLIMFMDRNRHPGAGATYTVVPVNSGEYWPNDPTVEASVDVQYASGMAYPTPITYYSVGNGPGGADDPFLSWLNFMVGLDDAVVPQTISVSYVHYERAWPLDHAIAVCDLFLKLSARGVSVLVASGDWGVGRGDCITDGVVRFRPTFPASCPWVTCVGGTTGGTSDEEPEVAAEISGGGFSDYFERPDYQDGAMAIYSEALGDQYYGSYNATSRGFPDLAAQSLFLGVMVAGEYQLMEGTSFSAPIVAGIISLLNDFRISRGKNPLGFLNPLLYGIGRAGLNDITKGSNPGCNTDGFSAVIGWDPVTGLGSLDFVHLQNIVNLLP
ncbi:subtilisin-like protein [Lactarius indigo]|nr:subtilisin-like protein [Lactarius indigo]